jgi:hypothetical protein
MAVGLGPGLNAGWGVALKAAGTGVRVPLDPSLVILLPCLFYKLFFGETNPLLHCYR